MDKYMKTFVIANQVFESYKERLFVTI